jgi:hypothetical protein
VLVISRHAEMTCFLGIPAHEGDPNAGPVSCSARSTHAATEGPWRTAVTARRALFVRDRRTDRSFPIGPTRVTRPGHVAMASGWRRGRDFPLMGPPGAIKPHHPREPDNATSVRAEIRPPHCGTNSLASGWRRADDATHRATARRRHGVTSGMTPTGRNRFGPPCDPLGPRETNPQHTPSEHFEGGLASRRRAHTGRTRPPAILGDTAVPGRATTHRPATFPAHDVHGRSRLGPSYGPILTEQAPAWHLMRPGSRGEIPHSGQASTDPTHQIAKERIISMMHDCRPG